MTEAYTSAIWWAYTVVYAGLLLGGAGLAAHRLRASPAGVVLAGALALTAVKAIGMRLVRGFLFTPERSEWEVDQMVATLGGSTDVCLGLAVVVGLALIPMALGRRTVT